MDNSYIFSFYPGPIKNTKPSKKLGIKETLDLIKSESYKADIEKLRACNNKIVRKTLKNCLPYVTFSGEFKQRDTEFLVKHSGIICIDLDPYKKVKGKEEISNPRLLEEFDIVFDELCQLDFVCFVFRSPSGNGYKVGIKIVPDDHGNTFDVLKEFFEKELSLIVDKGVRDIARACFLSYDPNLYYNPGSKLFEIELSEPYEFEPFELEQEKSPKLIKQEEDAQAQFKKNKDLRRALYVVEQIEEKQIDLTSDYDDWQLIAFSLAALGEPGRNIFHRVSKFHAEYDPKATDDKFDDAVKKGRFQTAGKFFKIAQSEGCEIKLPRTIEEQQKLADAKSIIGDPDSGEDWAKYGIYLNKRTQTYFSLDTKGGPREISNFKMKILFHMTTSNEAAYRLISIKNIHGLDRVVRINTDDFVSAGSFKKVIARVGNFLWKGQDFDLIRLQDMLQRDETPTVTVQELGWNKKGKFYAFANGVYDTVEKRFIETDNYGIVSIEREGDTFNYFIPALSSVFADYESMYVNDKKFIYQKSEVTFEHWAILYYKVFGSNGMIAMLFYISALFSDIIFTGMNNRFPIFFVYGKRGTGKGAILESIMRLFGEGQDQLMLGGASTIVGFMRKLAQYVNSIVWFDEYKNNINPKSIESIKNTFDRKGPERGNKDQTYETNVVPVRSALAMSGQEMPTAENALFTRTIMVTQTKTNFTDDERIDYNFLKDVEFEGISHITAGLLSNRSFFEKHFKRDFGTKVKEFYDTVKAEDIDERMVKNYAMLLTVYSMMCNRVEFPFTYEQLLKVCKDLLLNQHVIVKGTDDTAKFWQVVEQLFSGLEIQEGQQFKTGDGFLYIRIQDVYQLYAEAMHRRREAVILDKATLEDYLSSDLRTFVGKQKKQFGGKYTSCYVFKYADLGINLIRETDPLQLKNKYKEMGIDFEDEVVAAPKSVQMDAFNAGFPEPDRKEVTL
ncbi:PriCT-2 domain-containing protein [Sphingobacterium sp. ML3W]|uniref:BT4734/BF3469 family protein n=1 Tax=Sphingobacterium sp. ML3W TaxID=1538644 RepID=UPI00249B5686|nr:BT4734/BF3469 family protein [Sphingobacterium sp. ML3W]WFA77310.1 PriCT-2 domain-containing protein [Sphingobacterium sp. ML3W]